MLGSAVAFGFDTTELYRLKVMQGVDLGAVEELLESCEVRLLTPGDVLLSRGQTNRSMFMILEGALTVHLEGPQSDSVATLETGQTVGELSLLEGVPASAFVVAAHPSRLLELDEKRFWDLIYASHDFTVNLMVLLSQRLRANNSTVSTNIQLQREHKRNASIDGLTGLYNRRWIEEALPRFVTRYGRVGGQSLAILMLDIDFFKKVNDTFGHPAGDYVIVSVAKALRENLRPADLVARYGGEEYLVILPDTDGAQARQVGERLRGAVEGMVLQHDGSPDLHGVTISVGGVCLAPGQSMTEFVDGADRALYDSKHNGRNRVTVA